MEIASGMGLVAEEERRTDWGGWYSIYSVDSNQRRAEGESSNRAHFLAAAAEKGAIELELAATAAFLYAEEQIKDPWAETARRKPEKAGGDRLERAKAAYRQLLALNTPRRLPEIA